MKRAQLKKLWHMRFKKMRAVEKNMLTDYEVLIQQNKQLIKSKKLQKKINMYLEQLIREEDKHVGLVDGLIHILKKQKD